MQKSLIVTKMLELVGKNTSSVMKKSFKENVKFALERKFKPSYPRQVNPNKKASVVLEGNKASKYTLTLTEYYHYQIVLPLYLII